MASVAQFAQYLLKLDPQRNSARLALFNFLKHVIEPTQAFTPQVIQAFYGRILQFDHWQNDAENLSNTIRGDVLSFIKQLPPEREAQEWAEIRHPDTLQVVSLKVYQDLADIVNAQFEPRLKSSQEQMRLIKLSEQQMLAILLKTSGELEIKVFPNQALVWGARLRPMTPVTELYYTSSLELAPHVHQTLEGSLLTTHCFRLDMEGVHGLIVRGYSLQKFETFIRAKMSETQDLFNSLKKLERHFIDPQSDPDYQDLVSKLERANRMLNHPTPDNLNAAERALHKGRLYLKNAFPNDRLLGLLVTHLDYGISQTRAGHQPSPSQ